MHGERDGYFPKVSGKRAREVFPESFGHGGRDGYFLRISGNANETYIFRKFARLGRDGYFLKFGYGERADVFRKFRSWRVRLIFSAKFGRGGDGYFFGAGAAAVFKSLDKAFCIIL